MEFSITKRAREELAKVFKNKTVRIHPKMKTWSGITYIVVQDEQEKDDNVYNLDNISIILNRSIEKEISYIEIDFVKEWWGEDFVVTAGF